MSDPTILNDIKRALDDQTLDIAEILLDEARSLFSRANVMNKLYVQLQAAYVVYKASLEDTDTTWFEAFGLNHDQCSLHDIKRQYKRLASLVHPDKLPKDFHSSSFLFQSLQNGYEKLSKVKCQQESEKNDNACNTSKAADPGDDENDEEDAYAWWTEWDSFDQNRKGNGGKKNFFGKDDSTNDTRYIQNQQDESRDDISMLSELSVDVLRSLVQQRQDAMLSNSRHDGMTIMDLKNSVQRAKMVLIAKLQTTGIDSRDQCCGSAGGFIRE